MNILFLKKYHGENTKVLEDGRILKIENEEVAEGEIPPVHYFIDDLISKKSFEILPKVPKFAAFRIVDGCKNTNFIYMTRYLSHEKAFLLIRYDLANNSSNVVLKYHCPFEKIGVDRQISIFVLNNESLILQEEFLRENLPNDYQGFFYFHSYLYNLNERKRYEIIDDNLLRNGIETIMPLNDNQLIIKTGYNLLTDNRYSFLDKIEVSVESVSVVTTTQFISDIMINRNGIYMEAIEQTYFDQTIPRAEVIGDYLIFSKVDFKTWEELTVFYNYTEKKTYSALNKNVTMEEKLSHPLLISQIPYVKILRKDRTDYLNLISQSVDIQIPKNKELAAVFHEFLIVTENKPSLFHRDRKIVTVLRYPSLTELHAELGDFHGCIYDSQRENLYIY